MAEGAGQVFTHLPHCNIYLPLLLSGFVGTKAVLGERVILPELGARSI